MPRQNVVVDPAFPRRLRELREQAGLSLRALATQALSSKSHLADFESGRKAPSVEAVERIDQALSAGGKLARMVSPAPHWRSPDLRRRSVVSLAAGLAAGFTAGVSPDPYVGTGQRLVTQAQNRTTRLRRLDDHLGGADTYGLYLAELEATSARVCEGSESETTTLELLAVMAEQAQMAGFSAFDAGWHTEAERLFRLSLSAAEDARDAATAANALTFLGYQSLALGGRGADYSTVACDMAANCTPRVRALLLERRAWAHAVERDPDQARRCLDDASTALREYDDRPDPDWTTWVDDTEIAIMTGRCWAVLNRPLRAVAALEDALRRYDDTHSRDKALYLTFLAQAYLDSNEVERACELLDAAMDLAAGVRSTRPRQRVEVLVRRMDRHRAVPRVAELIGTAEEWISRSRSLPAPIPGTALEPPPPPQR